MRHPSNPAQRGARPAPRGRRGPCAPLLLVVTCAGAALAAGVTAAPGPSAPVAGPATTLIDNARVVDGSGAPARRAAVRFQSGRIMAVGDLQALPGETVIDARGLTLAPGFIDTHSHADDDLFRHPGALGAVSQGITTIIGGQDGGSSLPLRRYFKRLEKTPAAVNVASYAGHGTIRGRVMGKDFRRRTTPGEIRKMVRLLHREMRSGALGLATGLEYDPGIYSGPDEVIALAKVAAEHKGRYISHVRSEDRRFWEAIEEIITIGREARLPVQVSHTKLAMRNLWGQTGRLLGRLEEARAEGVDITGDIYPYTYWHSTLTVLFPERNFEDRAAADLVLSEIAPPDGLLLGRFQPEPSYAGKTVAQIAALRGTDPAATLMDLIRESLAWEKENGEDAESVIGTSMTEEDVDRLIAWPHMNICSDGSLDGSHPRGFGAFTRVLARQVRERRVLSLEEAIRKMTGLSAAHMGLRDRGLIQAGHHADLVLFDPERVLDRATTIDPHALSEGIERVWVNGVVVYEGGKSTGQRPGRVLRRPD